MRYLAAISLALLCGCPINMDAEYYAKVKSEQEEMAGKYAPVPSTVTWVRGEGKYPAVDTTLLLGKEGSFQMSHMPDWWRNPSAFGESNGRFDSGNGNWRIVKHQESWHVELTFESRKDFSSDPADGGCIASVQIVGKSPPYRLWFYVGDIDMGKVMIFQKEPDGS